MNSSSELMVVMDVSSQQAQGHASLMDFYTVRHEWAGEASFEATLKKSPEDFRVYETLNFEASGEGQHLAVLIEKTQLNTQEAQGILAAFFQVKPRDIGYFGLKDRFAVTQQWFSIDMAGSSRDEHDLVHFDEQFPILLRELASKGGEKRVAMPNADKPAAIDFNKARVKVLAWKRNHRKFHIGQHASNRFELVCRQVRGKENNQLQLGLQEIQKKLEARLEHIQQHGFANYFGEQRFGHRQQNIVQLQNFRRYPLDRRRALRARLISTLRSLAFNHYLALRIEAGNHSRLLPGDVLQFCDGKTLVSQYDDMDSMQARIDKRELCITGPLLGEQKQAGALDSLASAESLELEEYLQQSFQSCQDLLNRYRVRPARRPLTVQARKLSWYFSADDLFLNFELPPGSFATSLVSELLA